MMLRRLLLLPVILIAHAGLAPAGARAGLVLISTLNGTPRADTPLADPSFWAAQSFRTDNASYTLMSIEAVVGGGLNSPVVVAQLRGADPSGLIDQSASGLLDTLTPPGVSGSQSARFFTPSGSVTLTPNTTYWLVLGETGPGSYLWTYEDTLVSPPPTGPGSIPIPMFADSSNAGTTWNYGSVDPYMFQVNVNPGSAVPEPSSLMLFGLGGTGLIGLAWRRRRLA